MTDNSFTGLETAFAMSAGEYSQQCPHAQIDEGASLPFSFPSQPPDIRNWFSSYEYESPTSSDASIVLEDVSKELLLNDSAKEDPIPIKEEKLVENRNSLFFEESSRNEYSRELNFNPEGRRALLFDDESVLKGTSQEKTTGTCDIRPNDLHPIQKNENYPIIKNEIHESLNNINSQNEILQCEESFSTHNDSKLKIKKNSGISNEDQKENVEMMAENGFISTRNRDDAKKHGENLKAQFLIANGKRSKFELHEDNGVFGKERTFPVRGVLADKTNACFAEEAIKAEAPGKWQCPRRSKPYAGPPLKQLRLERWVRRVV